MNRESMDNNIFCVVGAKLDRLYRLGQENEVYVYQYYVDRSLEMNILEIQRRKGELAYYVTFYISIATYVTTGFPIF
jgi:predicted DNA-binding transcriptional regulator